jgi:outer membrane protein OmpA-like peptidoglycan-associated protein
MKKLLVVSAGLASMMIVAPARAQDKGVSEDDARCFVSGVCKVEGEKKFSLATISTKKSATPAAPASTAARAAPAAAKPVARRAARTAAPARKSLDMQLSFQLGSAELTPQARAQADVFAKVLSEAGAAGGKFAIEGHTDSIGSRASNLDLSRRRAESVVSYLVGHGVSASQVEAVGYGFDKPRAGTRASNPVNRRVEIVRR